MYVLLREDGHYDEIRYDIVNSSNSPLMAYVYPLRIAPISSYSTADAPNINVIGRECELVTEWFSLGLVR